MKHFTRTIGALLAVAMLVGVLLTCPLIQPEAAAAPAQTKSQSIADQVVTAPLAECIQDGLTLQCWNWSIANIQANLGLIANMGYTSIQVSPIQTLKEGTVDKPYKNWWVVYQPICFEINTSSNNAIGTKDELISLCEEAHKYGIKVIVDVVTNHLANNGDNTLSPMIPADIRGDASCWHDYTVNSSNYASRYDITQHCMSGLPDLNTSNKKIQNYVLDMLKDHIDCGVDGFRFDAAKQIETPRDDSSFASDYWPTVVGGAYSYAASKGKSLYCYGEVLGGTDDNRSLPITAYTEYISITESTWSNDVRYRLDDNNAAGLRPSYFENCNADKMVLWAESHDTFGDGSSANVSQDVLDRAWALVASRAYVMSLYFPRANDMLYQEMGEMAKVSWTSNVTRAINGFHNHFVGQSEWLTQDTVVNMYYKDRGISGCIIVIFNVGGRSIEIVVYAMAAVSYKDQITGNTFTVSGGRIRGQMGDSGIAVVYNPTTVSCAHSGHGTDGYCYDCHAYVGHSTGVNCSTNVLSL